VRAGTRASLAAIALLASGCVWRTPRSSIVAGSDYNRAILHVYAIITGVTVVIALIVFVVLAYVLARYRERPGTAPATTRGHPALEIAWTMAPALVLLVIAIPTIQIVFRTQGLARPGSLEVTVIARQWWWEFRYAGLEVVTANELHLPAGRPVLLRLEGPDVIHSFWAPPLGGKRDVVPGRLNQLAFTADLPGEYWGQCAEYCGASHAHMGFRVFVDAPDAFDRWVGAQRAAAAEPQGAAADGKAIFAGSACVGCHTIKGVSAGTLGPDLTHFGSRTTFAAAMFPNSPDILTAWIKNAPALKAGAKMPALGLSDDQARAIAAYLTSLK
jgi:cytochrome c oxidase subunit II